MNQQELVKKAIADRAVPLETTISDEDLNRYAGIANLEEFHARHALPLGPSRWRDIDWGSAPGAHNVREVSLDVIRTMYPMIPDYNPVAAYMHDATMYGSGMGSFMGISRSTAATAVLEPPPAIPRPSKDILKRFQVTDVNVTDMRSELASEAESLLGYSVLRKSLKMQSPLTTALLKLEIEPFEMASVKAYKDQMLKYAQNEAAIMDAKDGIRPGMWSSRVASWKRSDIDGYTKPIPEYAIEKALQVKKACPAVEFEIEEMTVVPDPFLIAVLGNVRRYIEVWDEPKFEG